MNKVIDERFESLLFDQIARISKSLASPRRLELIDLLAQGERTVEALARETGMSMANTSRHLQELKAARLLVVRRDGLYAFYRLADAGVFRVWQTIRDLAETRLGDIDRLVRSHLSDRSVTEAITPDELLDRMRLGDVLVLDARPEREHRAGHIAGAVSLPLEDLDARLHVLPMDQHIVVYSRGPYCRMCDRAIAMLRLHGYDARRLAVGFPDWRAAGLPVGEGEAAATAPSDPR
jgi:rhodanese-related sulfurtransferase